MLQIETKLQKCIRMEITVFKIFIFRRYIFEYTVENPVLLLRSCVTVKLNFRRYTSPNENFEYSYPLNYSHSHQLTTVSGFFSINLISLNKMHFSTEKWQCVSYVNINIVESRNVNLKSLRPECLLWIIRSLYKMDFRGQKFHSSARFYEWNLERTCNSTQSTPPVGQVLWEELLEEVILLP